MKEFIDKLIERLEEESNNAEAEMHILADSEYSLPCQFDRIDIEDCKSKTFCEAIQIVNELAEEYKEECEYKEMIAPSGDVFFLTDCGNRHNGYLDNNRPYCGFCGKKIKIAPYTEGE